MGLREVLSNAVIRYLTKAVGNYQRRIPNNLERLKKHARPGDVMLVEGKTRLAQIVKYLTQSSWSHSTLYVGDRFVSGSDPSATHYQKLFGDESRHMIIEADLANGVAAVPIVKYADHNVRICRPYSISSEDLGRVMEEVISFMGSSYDSKHLLDLGRYLTPFHLVPERWRRKAFFAGPSSSRSVICSSLIARAFINNHYPIMPILTGSEVAEREKGIFPSGPRFRSVHPRLVLPRDFDLSPYFRVVKFNQIEVEPFDCPGRQWGPAAGELSGPPSEASEELTPIGAVEELILLEKDETM